MKKISEFENYDEYLDLIKNKALIKLLIFSRDNCKACKKALIDMENLLKSLNDDRLIFKEVKLHSDIKKNESNSKIFDNYKINYVPSYILIYNNNFEKMINPKVKYINERLKINLQKFTP